MDHRSPIVQDFRINNKEHFLGMPLADYAIAKTATGILVSILLATFMGLSAKAQTSITESDYLENIEAGNDSQWGFSGTSESVSVEDEILNLEEYDISESDSTDLWLNEESRRRNSRRGIKDYSIETEIYGY
ncbi:MAG: hypothetical protein AAGE84_15390 [Cyanobacteria bacterium P01_G01_bin.39]